MELLTPKLGLFFWTLVIFLILVWLLSKFAWKPIMGAIKAREESIEQSLKQAEKARDEMSKLQADNEALLRKARTEREEMLKEARELREGIIEKAKEEAKEETQRMMRVAREEMDAEKMRVLTEIKNQVGILSLEVAEKLLRQKMTDDKVSNELVNTLIKDLHLS